MKHYSAKDFLGAPAYRLAKALDKDIHIVCKTPGKEWARKVVSVGSFDVPAGATMHYLSKSNLLGPRELIMQFLTSVDVIVLSKYGRVEMYMVKVAYDENNYPMSDCLGARKSKP